MINKLQCEVEEWFNSTEYGKKRYIHTLGVMEMALSLNKINNFKVAEWKIKTAALLHDVGKMLDQATMLAIIRNNKEMLEITDKDFLTLESTPNVWHGYVSVYLAITKFKVKNKEILKAIKYHTTGNKKMSKLSQLIYLSDAVEKNRTYQNVEKYREITLNNFDLGLITVMKDIIKMLESNGEIVHPLSYEALKYYERVANGKKEISKNSL